EGPQVYTLKKARRANNGQYQCRAWKGVNGTVISWPNHAGKVIVKKIKRGSGSKKPGNKKIENLKPANKKSGVKRPGNKKSGVKRPGNKKAGVKRPGNKKSGVKRPGNKKSGVKRPGNKKSQSKKREKKRRPDSKKPGNKRPDITKPGSKKSVRKRPSHKKSGKKRPGSKKQQKKSGSKKTKFRPQLKTTKTNVTFTEGSNAILHCLARTKPSGKHRDITISWYKDGKPINTKPLPSHISIVTKTKLAKRKFHSLLMIKSFKKARDQGTYQCRAIDENGRHSDPLTIKVGPTMVIISGSRKGRFRR
ncbi:hypothetical protein QZH41_018807, partial [Actinostola sp. cb2023]